jgi:hypothetical protein
MKCLSFSLPGTTHERPASSGESPTLTIGTLVFVEFSVISLVHRDGRDFRMHMVPGTPYLSHLYCLSDWVWRFEFCRIIGLWLSRGDCNRVFAIAGGQPRSRIASGEQGRAKGIVVCRKEQASLVPPVSPLMS